MLLRRWILFLVFSYSTAVPVEEFFPYGSEVGDSNISSTNTQAGPLNLPSNFYYFDTAYRQLILTRNGIFSFQPIFDSSLIYPQALSSLRNSSILTAFWFTHQWNSENSSGDENQVYYQIHSNSTKVFSRANDYVRKSFPAQRSFKAKMVIIGTWINISRAAMDYTTASSNQTDANQFGSNTYQVVLCSDEDRSFVFFLYDNLKWSDGRSAQAGFHHSETNQTELLAYSGTSDIVKLANESNVHVRGLFAYRVDANRINAGGCNETTATISFRPRITSQLGSTALIVYGPCLTNQTQIQCRFGSQGQIVNGFVVDDLRGICLTPFSSVHGSIPVSIKINNGTFQDAGHLTYSTLKLGSDEVTVQLENGENLISQGQFVTLKWKFPETMKNLFPNGTKIDVELYQLKHNPQTELQQDHQRIILVQNLTLTDSIRLQLPSSISNISTCFIRVKAHFNSRVYAGLNTGLLLVRSSPSSATQLCESWLSEQVEASTWNGDSLLQCPMTITQALNAARCCYKLDQYCYRGNTNPSNCWLHQARPGRDEPSAVECYMSITSNRHGAGAKCCYDNTSMLITRGTGAGTDDRYSLLISPTKHMFYDTLSYLQCCLMNATDHLCQKYMHYRPVRRGSNTMGQTGRMWGDPHFGTLDGSSYTFNGYGEYTYLAITNNSSPLDTFNDSQSYLFISQIRTVPLSTSRVTITKGFAAKSNDADAQRISVTFSPRDQLVLLRGNEVLEFEDNINTFSFPELIINRINAENSTDLTLSWFNGVNIQIKVIQMTSPRQQSVLDIAASVPGHFRRKTYGLLGTYDGNPNNDLRPKNGSTRNKNATLEDIHNNFGVTWAINPADSLFYYQSDQNATFFRQQNGQFSANFTDLTTINNPAYRQTCAISNTTNSSAQWTVAQRTCYYDLIVTNDIDFAKASLTAGNALSEIEKNLKNPPSFNTSLPLTMNLSSGVSVELNMSATSEDPAHRVTLTAPHLPQGATFNATTGIFQWKSISGEHYLSVKAHDTTGNLESKHDITFLVEPPIQVSSSTSTSTVSSSASTSTGLLLMPVLTSVLMELI